MFASKQILNKISFDDVINVNDEDSYARITKKEYQTTSFNENFDQEKSRLSCQIKLTQDMDGLSLRIAPEE